MPLCMSPPKNNPPTEKNGQNCQVILESPTSHNQNFGESPAPSLPKTFQVASPRTNSKACVECCGGSRPPPRWYGPQVVILLVLLLLPLLLLVLVLLLLVLLILILRSARSTSTITTTSTSTSTTTIIVTTRTSTTIPHPHHRRVGGCHPTLYHIFELWIEIFETTSDDVVVTHSRYNSAKNTRKDSQSSMAMGSDALNSKGVISPPCYPFLPDLSVWLVINLARKNIIC